MMSYSGRKINYSIRPAKSIERKMICDYFKQANKHFDISSYRYIGFGASYFTDFILFHREFKINQMISMENNLDIKDRFEFNKPYGHINILYGDSNKVLRNDVEWDNTTKDIIWLDYDGALNGYKLNEIEFCINKIVSGSFIIISFNPSIAKDDNGDRIPEINERFRKEQLLTGLKEKNLDNIELPKFYNNILRKSIDKALYEKNSRYVEPCDQYEYMQVMNFKYQDAAQMLTMGYVFYKVSDKEKVNKCSFHELDTYSDGTNLVKIDVPNFTYREIQELNKYTDNIDEAISKFKFITEMDIRKYYKIYRYYPHYNETSFIN